jgi:hypothetical protein
MRTYIDTHSFHSGFELLFLGGGVHGGFARSQHVWNGGDMTCEHSDDRERTLLPIIEWFRISHPSILYGSFHRLGCEPFHIRTVSLSHSCIQRLVFYNEYEEAVCKKRVVHGASVEKSF